MNAKEKDENFTADQTKEFKIQASKFYMFLIVLKILDEINKITKEKEIEIKKLELMLQI